MRNFLSLIVINFAIVCSTGLLAQPGGGGGMLIFQLLTNENQKIDHFNNSALKIRAFNIFKGKIIEEASVNIGGHRYANYSDGDKDAIYIEPPRYSDFNCLSDSCFLQRLFIIYKQDTMIVDFIDVLQSNPGGIADKVEFLVVKTGYYIYNPIKESKWAWGRKWGLTYSGKLDMKLLDQ